MANDYLDDIVNDIVDQLKSDSKKIKEVAKTEITSENLEQFLIDNTSRLIQRAVEATNDIDATDPEAAEALAELIKASSAAIEALNRLHISKEKAKALKEVKTMDIQSREKLALNRIDDKVTFSREEIIKHLFTESPEPQKLSAIDV
jgi:hypothetical protein